jgi:MFS family permease
MNQKVIRNMVFMSLGKSVSLLGSSIYTFAMGLYVLKITGSGLSFAFTLVLGTLPVILINPLAGVIADRCSRKYVVVIADLLNGCFLFGVLLFSLFNGLGLLVIYSSTFIINVVTVIFDISLEAAIPDMVTSDHLMGMNSANRVIESAAAVLGPMLGGFVYIFTDIRIFICLNAFSFIFSAIMGCCVDFRLGSMNDDTTRFDGRNSYNIIEDIRSGIAYMKGRTEITGAFIFLAGLNFFIGFSVLVPLPYIINNVMRLGSINYGIVQSAFPIGALLGAVSIRRWNLDIGYMKILVRAAVVLACSILFIALPVLFLKISFPSPVCTAYYCVVMGTMGIAAAYIDIPLLYMLQTKLPANLRGRVLSLGMSMVKTASPLAFILSGICMDLLPTALLPFIGGVLMLLYTAIYNRRITVCRSSGNPAENIII